MTQDTRADIDRLAEATIAALRAPSILNTQPWRWRLVGHHAELSVDPTRQLPGIDPDGRLLLLSCGTALHHAVVALAAGGFNADVARLPDAERPELVARLGLGAEAPPEQALYRAIYQRRTDRRPFRDTRPTDVDLTALRTAARRHGAHLHVLPPDQVLELASAVARAGLVEHDEQRYRDDLTDWTTRGRASRDGVSARTTVAPGHRTISPRDFTIARPPGLPLGPGNDRGTVYGILHTDGDEPRDWLAAGEALSDMWLTLTDRGLAASPISEVVEVVAVRQTLRRLLGNVGYPAIAIRVGVPVDDALAPPPSIRRSGTEAIELP